MKLCLIGHDYRYAMEQIQLMLFPEEKIEYTKDLFVGDGAVSRLFMGDGWVTATAVITRNGQTYRGGARCRRANATEARQRQILRQSYYRAALPLFPRNRPGGRCPG